MAAVTISFFFFSYLTQSILKDPNMRLAESGWEPCLHFHRWGEVALGFSRFLLGFHSFIQLGTSLNRKNLEVSVGIRINVLWDVIISAKHESQELYLDPT